MSLGYEQIRGFISELPALERQRLLDELKEELEPNSLNGADQSEFEWPDSAPNDNWLKHHALEFHGRWVALENGELLASGNDSQALARAVKESGAKIPLILFISNEWPNESPTNVLPFIGWL